jgi:glyceraldehyde 3-phosphate dehydrogenase
MTPASPASHHNRLSVAETIIPVVGALYRDNGVVTHIHGRSLIGCSPEQLLKAHRFARHAGGQELDVEQTLELLVAMAALNPGAANVDVGAVIAEWRNSGQKVAVSEYVAQVLAPIAGQGRAATDDDSADIVLYGFGRIGRLLARILLAKSENGRGPRLRAIVVREGGPNDLVKRASLLRRDSVHGPFNGTITLDTEKNIIIANGNAIQVIYANNPASIDYTAWGISNAIIVDNTGNWRDDEGLRQHLASKGAARVLLTAPGKSPLKNIVYGINNDTITESDDIVTAASCTTNAITPVLRVIHDTYGIEYGHVETVHSYTNDQNLIDNFHKGDRRGRSAALNMVLTETGAAKAVAKAIPELEGKLTGNAIRVPTPDVSMAILNLTLSKPVDRESLNAQLREASLHTGLRQQIDYIESPEVVSTDFLGSNRAGIVDGLATISTGNHAVVYVWYDNEYGYSHQVVRIVEQLSGKRPPRFPAAQ